MALIRHKKLYEMFSSLARFFWHSSDLRNNNKDALSGALIALIKTEETLYFFRACSWIQGFLAPATSPKRVSEAIAFFFINSS